MDGRNEREHLIDMACVQLVTAPDADPADVAAGIAATVGGKVRRPGRRKAPAPRRVPGHPCLWLYGRLARPEGCLAVELCCHVLCPLRQLRVVADPLTDEVLEHVEPVILSGRQHVRELRVRRTDH